MLARPHLIAKRLFSAAIHSAVRLINIMSAEEAGKIEDSGEFDTAQEIGEEFAALETLAPSTEQFDDLWQAQLDFIKRNGKPPEEEEDDESSTSSVQTPVEGEPVLLKRNILLVEDDSYVAQDYGKFIEALDFKVSYAYTVDDALRIAKEFRHFDAAVIDIKMSNGEFFGDFETVAGHKTGIFLARELIQHLPDTIFVALTRSEDMSDAAWFEAHEGFAFIIKKDSPPKKFSEYLIRKIMKQKEIPNIFIVHGHDYQAALDLKNYLQNVLKLPEPIILKEKASKGMTVIEKLEHYAEATDIVFALFTPDDVIDSSSNQARSRQNVIFEFGFFLGRLGRRSGKVFLLYKKGVEIPSDLTGVIYIDISNGVQAAGEEIRRELEDYL